MKILAALTSRLLLLVGVRGRDPDSSALPDTCNYTKKSFMCGDQCVDKNWDKCHCGPDTIKPIFDNYHCCGESCILDPDEDGVCSQGRKLSKSSPCNTTMGVQCYNSYQHSQYIGEKSHYTCPDTCVPWEAMCRGVSQCEGDHQVCGPDLRCPDQYHGDIRGKWYIVKIRNFSSSLVSGHHYCFDKTKINDGQFDTFDRSDET